VIVIRFGLKDLMTVKFAECYILGRLQQKSRIKIFQERQIAGIAVSTSP
jgi:hypothetical protein